MKRKVKRQIDDWYLFRSFSHTEIGKWLAEFWVNDLAKKNIQAKVEEGQSNYQVFTYHCD